MRTIGGIVWALTFGLAVCLVASGIAIIGTIAAPTPAVTHGMEIGTDIAIEPWPTPDALAAEVARDAAPDDTGNVTIILAARWGYLNDSFAALRGAGRFNQTRTGGGVNGGGHLVGGRPGGGLRGGVPLPPRGGGGLPGGGGDEGGEWGGAFLPRV